MARFSIIQKPNKLFITIKMIIWRRDHSSSKGKSHPWPLDCSSPLRKLIAALAQEGIVWHTWNRSLLLLQPTKDRTRPLLLWAKRRSPLWFTKYTTNGSCSPVSTKDARSECCYGRGPVWPRRRCHRWNCQRDSNVSKRHSEAATPSMQTSIALVCFPRPQLTMAPLLVSFVTKICFIFI